VGGKIFPEIDLSEGNRIEKNVKIKLVIKVQPS
jgi:hypothetical protein